MTHRWIGVISWVIALTIGNFLWALATDRRWKRAAELSYFQAVAVVGYVLIVGSDA